MKPVPQISVIIPAFNAGKFLARALESVLVQQGCTYEILIVDNNSTDDTVAVAKDFVNRYPAQVKLLTEKKPGPSAARNRGLSEAGAEWVQFLDADDVLLPGKLARQVGMMEGADWIIGTVIIREIDGAEKVYYPSEDTWGALLAFGGMGHLDANLFRKTLLEELNGFDLAYPVGEDFDLFFRLAQRQPKIILDRVPGAVHINHSGPRLTRTNLARNGGFRLRLTERMIKYLRTENPFFTSSNQATINAALLRGIRMEARYDLPAGLKSLKKHFPQGLRKEPFPRYFLPRIRFLYRFLGFTATERLIAFLHHF